MKFTKSLKILLLIVTVGFFLRLYGSTLMPLYGDELTLVYDAYSILKTGHDQNGVFLPLTFQMAEGRPAGYVYFSIPFVAAFGPTLLGARMLSVLSGVGIIILLYLLGKKLVNDNVGLISAALFSISPLGIQLGSGGFETHFALFLTLLGVVLFLNGKLKPLFIILSAFFLGLAIHTYSAYKLTVPLLVIALIFSSGRLMDWLGRKLIFWSIAAIIIAGIFLGLLMNQALVAGSEGRFLHLNIFSQENIREKIIQKVNLERNLDTLPERLVPLFHNKDLEYAFMISGNFVNNFSLDFLFWHGDGNPRHNGATMGGLYPIELLFVLAGLFYLVGQKIQVLRLILPWLFIAPIPATLLMETHALRSSLMLPPLILLSAAGFYFLVFEKSKLSSEARGFYYLWDLIRQKWIKWLLPVLLLVQFIIFADRFYFLAPQSFSRFWSYPAKLASDLAIESRGKFDYIILSDSLDNVEFAYPVYAQVDPALVIAQNKQREELFGVPFKRLGNVYIGYLAGEKIDNFLEGLPGSVLYIGPVEEARFLLNFHTISGKDDLRALVYKEKLEPRSN